MERHGTARKAFGEEGTAKKRKVKKSDTILVRVRNKRKCGKKIERRKWRRDGKKGARQGERGEKKD